MQSTQGTLISQTIEQFLQAYRGRRAYFQLLPGNNGDTLIEFGSHMALTRARVQLIPWPEDAELIAINGGGAMNDFWQVGLDQLAHHSRTYPQTPLLVFPSSFFVEKTDLAKLLGPRQAPVYLYSRTRDSLDLLKSIPFSSQVHLGLDHDMSLQLRDSDYLRNLQRRCRSKHVLIVERWDREYEHGVSLPVLGGRWSRHVLTGLKTWAKRRIWRYWGRRQGLHTPFVSEVISRLSAENATWSKLPIFYADVSNPDIGSMRSFEQAICSAAVIVTTRLHVGILGAMLGKEVYFKVTTSRYRKIQGVYEYSLAQMPNVHLI